MSEHLESMEQAHPEDTSQSGVATIVCPSCHYGFTDDGKPRTSFVCPRPECGHRWEALTKTIQQIHLPDRRRAIPELRVVAGAPATSLELPEGEALIGRDSRCQLMLDNLN